MRSRLPAVLGALAILAPVAPAHADDGRVTIQSTGAGRVTSIPEGIDCRSGSGSCSATYAPGTQVSLTAQADPGGQAFVGDNCEFQSGRGTDRVSCNVDVRPDQEKIIRVDFRPAGATSGPGVQVQVTGGENLGRVQRTNADGSPFRTAEPCFAECFFGLASGEQLHLRADDGPSTSTVTFDYWSGACASIFRPRRCDLTGDGSQTLQTAAVFRRKGTLRFRVHGQGNVLGSYEGRRPFTLTCGRTSTEEACTQQLLFTGRYTFVAADRPGWRFARWLGFCARIGADATCDARESEGDRESTAVFVPERGRIAVSIQGRGRVLERGRRVCPGPCVERAERTNTYTASPGEDASFLRWEGCPHPEGMRCRFGPDDESEGVLAVFGEQPEVRISRTGQGQVRLSGGRGTCPAVCSPHIRAATGTIDLAPAPAGGWTFAGWEGECRGRTINAAGTCRLNNLSDDVTTRAVFHRG
jgi:hypothetical protein